MLTGISADQTQAKFYALFEDTPEAGRFEAVITVKALFDEAFATVFQHFERRLDERYQRHPDWEFPEVFLERRGLMKGKDKRGKLSRR